MIGYKYNELLARIQFIVFFIGVNLTFGPMHFLGLNGMVRRIADYPDSYNNWNYIASLGAMINIISVIIFIFIIYKQFTDKIEFKSWIQSDLFKSPNIPMFRIRSESFENLLSTPVKFHTFNELPVC